MRRGRGALFWHVHRWLLDAMATAPIECSLQVAAGTYAAGATELRGAQLVWRSTSVNVSGERVVELQNVTGHQRNKPGSKVASLRLVVNNDNKVRRNTHCLVIVHLFCS